VAIPSEEVARLYGLIQPLRLTEGLTRRQLSLILKGAAADAERLVEELGGRQSFSRKVRRAQLRAVLAVLDPVHSSMWNTVGNLIVDGMSKQGALAAHQSLLLDKKLGLPSSAVELLRPYIHADVNNIVSNLISRKTSGYRLADRIYKAGKVTTKQVGVLIDRALVQQLSHRELAAQVRRFYRPDVPGGASYAANRLARTEINNAHHHTSMRLSAQKPWVTGFKWNLSGSHPKPDECNEMAAHDAGLGEGVYPKGEEPDRPHPNCLCYVTHLTVEDDVFMDNLLAGRYDRYMAERGAL
jgi:hypothetical protein